MPKTTPDVRTAAPLAAAPPPLAAAPRVEAVETFEGLEALSPAWRRLLADRQVFVGPDWTIEWMRGPGARGKPFVVVAREADGTISGVLPLSSRRGVLSTCGASEGLAHVDVVAAAGRAPEVAEAVLDFLGQRSWSRLRLHRLAEDGALLAAVRRRAESQPVLERFATACPLVAHGGDWPGFLKDLSKHQRHEVTRQMRRFWERDGVALRWVREPAEVDAALGVLFDLHERRFGALGKETAFSGPVVRSFHGALARRLAERDALLLGILSDGGRPVAAAYGFHGGGTTSFFNAGIDPEFQRTGAGVVLRGHVLKDAVFGGGRHELDLLEGCQEWKLRWATGVRPLLDVDVFPAGVAGRVRRGLRGLVRTLRRRAAVAMRGEYGPGAVAEEPADPKHCRRLGCPYAPAESAAAAAPAAEPVQSPRESAVRDE